MNHTHLLAVTAAPAASAGISPVVALSASTTVAVILGVITAIHIWKKGSPRGSGWLALFTGLTGAPIILSWLGALADLAVYGVGVAVIVAIGGGYICWHELVKKRGLHRFRTPIIALATGAALMTLTGVAGSAAHGVSSTTTRVVSHVSGAGTGTGG
jgi:hypothetical protein